MIKKKDYFLSALILLIMVVFSCVYHEKNVFNDIEKTYKVPILYEDIETTYPDYWMDSPNNAKVEPLDTKQDLAPVKKALQDALSKYPEAVLGNNLRSIGLANKLFFYNEFYGGTYSQTFQKNSVYLSVHSSVENIDLYSYVLGVFHNEFSSILMKKYKFPESQWRNANSPNFKYSFEASYNPGLEAIKKKMTEDGSEYLHSQGFFDEYSLASVEEDFNTYSGVIFSYPEWVASLALKHKIIKEKLNIWTDFYLSIDPSFANTQTFKTLDTLLSKKG